MLTDCPYCILASLRLINFTVQREKKQGNLKLPSRGELYEIVRPMGDMTQEEKELYAAKIIKKLEDV